MPKKKNKPTTPEQDQIDIFAAVAAGMESKTPEERADRVERIGFYSLQDQHVVDACSGKPVEPWTETAEKSFREALNKIRVFFLSDEYGPIKEMLPGTFEWFETKATGITAREITTLGDFIDQLTAFMPLIQEELKAYKKEHGLKDVTFSEFINDAEGESIFSIVFNRARKKAEMGKHPLIRSGVPSKIYSTNDAISNALGGLFDKKTGLFIETIQPKGSEKGTDITFSNRNTKITAYTMITQEEGLTFETEPGRQYTRYDRCVFNAFATLTMHEPRDKDGFKYILPEKIYRLMENKDPSFYVHPEQVEPIVKSIEKMRGIKVISDVTGIYKTIPAYKERFKKNPNLNIALDDYLIVARRAIVNAGNQSQTKFAYQVIQEPLLLTHARALKQIVATNTYLRSIKYVDEGGHFSGSVKLSPSRIGIMEYLIQRIEDMKVDIKRNKGKANPNFRKILFDTLYRECDIDTTNRKTTLYARDFVFLALDYWKALKPQYIKGYTVQSTGNKIVSVTLKM